ncbi:carboxypeptidase-like regulatory domain-containing protein [Winogradskyella eckloniae]|uniref:DUF5686 family protein n=1 Tax=Winogradskyella eckloniae TaxID=1089306 RepID=UPI00156400D4|nr:DUF5686 family protein [Winogradskyella eckloniae]NRD18971.1 carboxypeptidase-like regulatory domain-containing protein [Winogradskyella eckloniae]
MQKLLILFVFFVSITTSAQTLKKFKLIDSVTQEVIPFANILFSKTDFKGTSSDIDGIFYIPSHLKTITVSYVGYETKVVIVEQLTSELIELTSKVSQLDEVFIDNENPAHRIIKNAVANKALNNPENLSLFTYTSYDKIYADMDGTKPQSDTLKTIQSAFKDSYLFITETIAKHKYLNPRFTEDSIIATRTSGFKNPNFALLANSLQPFSFYKEHLNLFEINYLNPISKGSTKKYKFRLKEEFIKNKDTIFVISFEPKANRNFDGLEGLLYINSNKYALESVDARTVNSGKVEFKLQQKYSYIDGNYWFPEQLNFEIVIGEGFGSFKYIGKSYLSEIKPNAPLSKKDFPLVSLTLSKNVGNKNSKYWDEYRKGILDKKELKTYVFIDSIGDKVNLDKVLALPQKLQKGRFPLKYIDIDLLNIFRANKHEDTRLGLGVYTNDNILENISFGAFAGYGIKDKEWKYGGSVAFDVPGKKDISIALDYKNTIREVGTFSGNEIENPFNPRNWIAREMDAVESISFRTDMKLLRNINWFIGFNTAEIKPLYDYTFNQNNISITNYNNTEVNIGISYHVNEKLINNFGIITRLPSNAPILNLMYSRGLNGALDGDFNYNKVKFTLDDSFIIKGIGETTYKLDLGYIDSTLPFGLLFTGEGTFDKKLPFIVENYFQTVKPYEFLSDRYAHLFTTHNFGRLFNNKGYFQPDVLLHNNIGIGSLKAASDHQFIDFSTKEELFLETGLELQNILKIPYLNIGYLGLGFGAFYRYGYHHLNNSNDNLALKLSFGFSFR